MPKRKPHTPKFGIDICDRSPSCACYCCARDMGNFDRVTNARKAATRNHGSGMGYPLHGLRTFRDEVYGMAYLLGWLEADGQWGVIDWLLTRRERNEEVTP